MDSHLQNTLRTNETQHLQKLTNSTGQLYKNALHALYADNVTYECFGNYHEAGNSSFIDTPPNGYDELTASSSSATRFSGDKSIPSTSTSFSFTEENASDLKIQTLVTNSNDLINGSALNSSAESLPSPVLQSQNIANPQSFGNIDIDETNNIASNQISRLDPSIFQTTSRLLPVPICKISTSAQIPLQEWLKKTFTGNNLLAIYISKSSFIFTDTNRNDLTHLVLERESDGFVVIPPIQPVRFIELANEIVQLFPRELVGTYYTPHVNKTQFSKGITAKGKLLYHHNFRRAKQRKALKLLKEQNQNVVAPEHADEEFNEKLNFLYEHLEPWPEVVANWEYTYEARQKILKNLNDVKAYYNKFPCLKQPLGYELLKIDFEKRFPNKTTCLRDKWPVFRDCIIRLLQTTRTPKNSILANIVTAELPTLQGDALDTTVLWILSAILKKSTPMIQDITANNPSKRGRKRKQTSVDPEEENLQWNPSTAEVQRGFLFHIEAIGDKIDSIDRVKRFMSKRKITFQPRPVITGPLSELQSIEVIINDTFYKTNTALDAVMISFYIFFALDIKYPPEARSTWLLIQKVIFDIHTAEDKNIPVALTTLIGDIKVVQEQLFPISQL